MNGVVVKDILGFMKTKKKKGSFQRFCETKLFPFMIMVQNLEVFGVDILTQSQGEIKKQGKPSFKSLLFVFLEVFCLVSFLFVGNSSLPSEWDGLAQFMNLFEGGVERMSTDTFHVWFFAFAAFVLLEYVTVGYWVYSFKHRQSSFRPRARRLIIFLLSLFTLPLYSGFLKMFTYGTLYCIKIDSAIGDVNCWFSTNSIYVLLGLLLFLVHVVFSFLNAFLGFNPNPQGASRTSAVNGHHTTMFLSLITVLTGLSTVPAYDWILYLRPVVVLAGSFGLFLHIFFHYPFFHLPCNYIRGGMYLGASFLALFVWFSQVFDNSSLILHIGLGCFWLFSILGFLLLRRRFRGISKIFHKSRDVEDLTLTDLIPQFTYKRDVLVALRIYFSDTSRKTIIQTEDYFRECTRLFPFSSDVKIAFGYFLVVGKKMNVEATRYIIRALSAQRLEGFVLDVQYTLRHLSLLRERWLAPVMGEESTDFYQRLTRANRSYGKTLERMRIFWTILLQETPNLNVLPRISESIKKHQEQTQQLFIELIADYPESPQALTQFAKFCNDVLKDTHSANYLNQIAEDHNHHEEEEELAPTASASGRTPAPSYPGTHSAGDSKSTSSGGKQSWEKGSVGMSSSAHTTSTEGALGMIAKGGAEERETSSKTFNIASLLQVVIVICLFLVIVMVTVVYSISLQSLKRTQTHMVDVQLSAERLQLNQAIATTSILFGLEKKANDGSTYYESLMKEMLDNLTDIHTILYESAMDSNYGPLRSLYLDPQVDLVEYFQSPNGTLVPYTRPYSMWDAGNKLIKEGLDFTDMTYEESLGLNPNTNRTYRFMIENGAFTISDLMATSMDVYIDYVESLLNELLLVRTILFLTAVLMILFMDFVVFHKVMDHVGDKRSQILSLFLHIPAHNIVSLCSSLDAKIEETGVQAESHARLIKRLEQEGAVGKVKTHSRKKVQWTGFPRHHIGLGILGVFVIAVWLVGYIAFNMMISAPYEVRVAGRRSYIPKHINILMYAVALNRCEYLPYHSSLKDLEENDRYLLELHSQLVNGRVDGVLADKGITQDLLYDTPCLRTDQKCGPGHDYLFGVELRYRGLHDLLLGFSEDTLAFISAPSATSEDFLRINQASNFDLSDGLNRAMQMYIEKAIDNSKQLEQLETILLVTFFLIMVIVYLSIFHPQVGQMRQDVQLTDELVQQIPEHIVEKVDVIRDYLETGVVNHVGDDRLADAQLAKSRAQMMRLLGVVTESVVVMTPAGEITSVNHAALSLLEFTLDDLIGQPITILFNSLPAPPPVPVVGLKPNPKALPVIKTTSDDDPPSPQPTDLRSISAAAHTETPGSDTELNTSLDESDPLALKHPQPHTTTTTTIDVKPTTPLVLEEKPTLTHPHPHSAVAVAKELCVLDDDEREDSELSTLRSVPDLQTSLLHIQKLVASLQDTKLKEPLTDVPLSLVSKSGQILPTHSCFSEFQFGSERVIVCLIKDLRELLMTEKALATAAEERKKSDTLLYNMIPAEVADTLRLGKKVLPQKHDNVTLFFSDIQGFTAMSSLVTPAEMIGMLDRMWSIYDTLAGFFGVHKVETIGDAYFGSCGCPTPQEDHAQRIVDFAHHIAAYFAAFKTPLGENIQIRIGVHSGPVVTGVLGSLVPHYTLVGDTVNTAARMEQTGAAGRVHCSESTAALLQAFMAPQAPNPKYKTTVCEEIDVKGKGKMVTYFIEPVEPVDRQTILCMLDDCETSDAPQRPQHFLEDYVAMGAELDTTLSLVRRVIQEKSATPRRRARPCTADIPSSLSQSENLGGMLSKSHSGRALAAAKKSSDYPHVHSASDLNLPPLPPAHPPTDHASDRLAPTDFDEENSARNQKKMDVSSLTAANLRRLDSARSHLSRESSLNGSESRYAPSAGPTTTSLPVATASAEPLAMEREMSVLSTELRMYHDNADRGEGFSSRSASQSSLDRVPEKSSLKSRSSSKTRRVSIVLDEDENNPWDQRSAKRSTRVSPA